MNARPLHILLVEDNPDHAELVRRGLENFPAAIVLHHVEDGEAALNFIFGHGAYADRKCFPAPDLVLLDLRLPRLGGLEVLRQVKCHPTQCHTPVVVLTTSDTERDVALARECHAKIFMTKPVDFQRLHETIYQLGFSPPAWHNEP